MVGGGGGGRGGEVGGDGRKGAFCVRAHACILLTAGACVYVRLYVSGYVLCGRLCECLCESPYACVCLL